MVIGVKDNEQEHGHIQAIPKREGVHDPAKQRRIRQSIIQVEMSSQILR